MIKFNAALEKIIDSVEPIESESVRLTGALGRVLAEDIYSDTDIPGFDNSAMDGFAVRSSDTICASSDNAKVLEVIEDIKAGDIAKKTIDHNQAIRIMTGATIPKGADSVIMVEYTKKIQNKPRESIEVYKELAAGENIRKKAEDIKKGELIISRGTLLNCGHIGILASLGRPKIQVVRRPKIAILATGDELVGVGQRLAPGKVRSSNTYTLYSQIVKCGCIPKNLGIAKDIPSQLEKKIRRGFDCDIILTSGGVSVGEFDLVKDVLAKIGTKIKFWQVAMRPGKPLVFGNIGKILIFGLPGNPVSGMISFEVFVRPVLLKMTGQRQDRQIEIEAVLEEDIQKKKGMRYFLRARTRWQNGRYLSRLSGPQGSALLKPMSLANSLVILGESQVFFKKGSKVKVRFLD
ncbi:MAG: molybdopterin molybdotransferase MoeA [Candidatus Omnitrophica bacterium]|nr:molybdopterin molybdotransferase MoeA [Candidatus Omnitrophota bacterium]MBU1923607.1 molybdopterin molybdotransferase MoeA [Candidatus Omnitrophota bacterium]